MPVTLALLSSKNSHLMANILSWSRVPLPTSLATSTPLWILLRGSGPCKQLSFETSDLIYSLYAEARPDQAHRPFSLQGLGPEYC